MWFLFNKIKQKDGSTESVVEFCKQYSFSPLSTKDQKMMWANLKEYMPSSAVNKAFTSTRNPSPELIASGDVNERKSYFLYKKNVHHQSSGHRRYTVGICIENIDASGEVMILPRSFASRLRIFAAGWEKISDHNGISIYSRQESDNVPDDDKLKSIVDAISAHNIANIFAFIKDNNIFLGVQSTNALDVLDKCNSIFRVAKSVT